MVMRTIMTVLLRMMQLLTEVVVTASRSLATPFVALTFKIEASRL